MAKADAQASGDTPAKAEAAKASARLAKKLAEPVRDRSDELLEDPPEGEHHLGRLAGYRAGRKIRRRLGMFMGVALIAIVVIAVRYQFQMRAEFEAAEYERLHPRDRKSVV